MSRRRLDAGLMLLAIAGCLGTYVGDLLLLAAPLSGREYFAVYQGTMVDASHTRLLWGNTLGVVFLPLQLFGLWALHRSLARAHRWLARTAYLGLAFAVIAGLAYHVTFAFVGTGLQVHRELSNEVTTQMVARFREYNLTLFRFAQVALTVGSLSFTALLLWKQTALPRWVAVFSPLALLLMVRALAALLPAPVGGFIAPGYFNLAMLLFFAICFGAMREQPTATRRSGAACGAAQQPSRRPRQPTRTATTHCKEGVAPARQPAQPVRAVDPVRPGGGDVPTTTREEAPVTGHPGSVEYLDPDGLPTSPTTTNVVGVGGPVRMACPGGQDSVDASGAVVGTGDIQAPAGQTPAAGGALHQAYRIYGRVAAAVFGLITVYTVATKLAQGRLAEDWLHSLLHLGSALAGAAAGWGLRSQQTARWFTWSIGLLYGALGLYGWFTPGFFLDTRAAIPLGPADNVFHLALAAPALAIAALHVRWSLRRAVGVSVAAVTRRPTAWERP